MNLDLYNNYLGQFISNFASMLSQERSAAETDQQLATNARWQAAQSQRNLLAEARELLISNMVVGFEGENYVSNDRWNPAAGVKISEDRLRAMAADAGSLSQIAMGGSGRDGWWYDPTSPDGLSSYFPGRTNNPGTV